MFRVFALAAAIGMAAASAHADLPSSLLDRARAAIAAGRLDEADHILGAAQDELMDRNDLDFLRGTVAASRGDYEAAIAAFRAILARDPSLNRVRLDLARVLFLAGDDEAAEHHFRIAQAEELPPEVRAKVESFLDAIKRRKRWSVDLSLGIAPDSNVNAGTAARTVDLFGLPFTLDDAARKNSGIGVASSIAGSYQLPLDADTRLVMGGRLSALDYQGDRFDDRTLSGHVGPRFLIGRGSEVTVSATASRRWYGGEGFSQGLGGRVSGQTMLAPDRMLSGSVELSHMAYDDVSAFDGPVAALNVGLTQGVDSASFVRLDLAVLREQARQEAFRDTQYFAGISYYRELPWGFSVTVGGALTLARYDATLAAFDEIRDDETVTGRLAVANRAIDLFGFTPVLSYSHSERSSTIALFDYERDRVELSFTRNF